jgi:hypothetical protein
MRLVLLLIAALAPLAAVSAKPRSNQGQQSERPPTAREASVTYSGCNAVRRLGLAPLRRGQPGYRSWMDGDNDGLACEPVRR